MKTNEANPEVIVIGAGPAGCTVATLLSQQGHRVLLLEKEHFPRHHIGESLMPETWGVFDKIGLLPKLKNSEFTRKYSVQFFTGTGKASRPFFFYETNPHESSVTWQVSRENFDQMLMDNAREQGVVVREGAAVRRVDFDGERAIGVTVSFDGGPEETLRAPVTVDATGLNAVLGRQLGVRKADPRLRKIALYTYYENAIRDEGENGGATLVLRTANRQGWFWFIPLENNITSIGVVDNPENLFPSGVDRKDLAAVFATAVESCPSLKERLVNARQTEGFRTVTDYSYKSDRCAADGAVMVGDAYGFLDPIYSSGVLLAFRGGEFAAEAIHEGLLKGDTSAAQLGSWQEKLDGGMEALRKLVYAFYSKDFSFGRFIREHPQFHKTIVDLLVGDVFKDDVHAIFGPMSHYCDLERAEEKAGTTA